MLDTIKVTPADVSRITAAITGLMQEEFSGTSFSEGTVLHDLVVRPLATVMSAVESDVKYLESRLSVDALIEDESESAAVLLDLIASNFFITRNPGGRATGIVTLKMSSNDAFSIQIGTLFEKTNGVTFVYDQAEPLTVTPDDMVAEVSSSGEPTGNYMVDVFVHASRPGIGSGAPPGTFEGMNPSPRGLISVSNSAPFSVVDSQESNYSLVNRIKSALTHRGFNTESSISAVLLDNVPECRSVKVVGSGDAEMQRDVLVIGGASPIRTLGKINIYAHTGFYPTTALTNVATTYRISWAEFFDASGNNVPVKSSLGGIELYGDKRVETLPADHSYRSTIETSYVDISYDDLKIARTSDETITLAPTSAPTTARVVVPQSLSLVESYVNSSGVKPVGSDTKIYYPTAKSVEIRIGYVRNTDIPAEEFPYSLVQSGIKGYVDTQQELGRHLSLSGLFSYISAQYGSVITAVVSDYSHVKYQILDTAGNMIHFNVGSDTSLANSTEYYTEYFILNGEVSSRVVSGFLEAGYLDSLQISDKTTALYCDTSRITLEEV